MPGSGRLSSTFEKKMPLREHEYLRDLKYLKDLGLRTLCHGGSLSVSINSEVSRNATDEHCRLKIGLLIVSVSM